MSADGGNGSWKWLAALTAMALAIVVLCVLVVQVFGRTSERCDAMYVGKDGHTHRVCP
jgi:hypothetical protein